MVILVVISGTALVVAAIVGAIGAIAGGAISAGYDAYQQQLNRDFNRNEALLQRNWASDEAQLDRSFQSLEAEKARDWQEYMSNTQYQRMRADLESAGINPTVFFSGGSSGSTAYGTTAPSGSRPTGVSASAHGGAGISFGNPATSAIGVASSMMSLAESYKRLTGVDGKKALVDVGKIIEESVKEASSNARSVVNPFD